MRQTLLQMINLMRFEFHEYAGQKDGISCHCSGHTPTTCNYTVPFYKKLKRKRTLNGPQKTEGENTEVNGRENTEKEKSQAREEKTLEFVLV